MNSRPLLYDLTRLTGRMFSKTPSGIDRVDLAFASHFLSQGDARSVALSLFGPALFDPDVSRATLGNVQSMWDRSEPPQMSADGQFPRLRQIETWLSDAPQHGRPAGVRQIHAPPAPGNARDAMPAYARIALRGGSLRKRAPEGSIYLNVSQFPLWVDAYVKWLDTRPDIACVAMVHDLLPLQYPEYFLPSARERHERRLAFLARRGTAVIVSTTIVEEALRAHLGKLGRKDMPILTAPLPVDDAFSGSPAAGAQINCGTPYFVVCGTIEPRKNHLLLLNLWRDMAAANEVPPRLIVVGRRGWKCENVTDLLDRCDVIAPYVLEVCGLSSPELRALVSGARALLNPSFAEGFGLPIAEAMAVGTPVVASDIPVFREVGERDVNYVHPLDGPGWRRAIRAGVEGALIRPAPQRSDQASYFQEVEAFLGSL